MDDMVDVDLKLHSFVFFPLSCSLPFLNPFILIGCYAVSSYGLFLKVEQDLTWIFHSACTKTVFNCPSSAISQCLVFLCHSAFFLGKRGPQCQGILQSLGAKGSLGDELKQRKSAALHIMKANLIP